MDIREFINTHISMYERIGHPALLERFVLRNGKEFNPIPYTGKKGTPKECFANATHYVLDQSEGTYVEGFVWRTTLPIPIHHAWVGIDNIAYDMTLEDPEECQYIGVEFPTHKLLEIIHRNGYYGLLDGSKGIDIKLMLEIDPGLIEFIPEEFKHQFI